MTITARRELNAVLGPAFGMSLLQIEPAQETAVQEDPDPLAQSRKGVDGKENCGLLHDTMSLQWGKFKDLVDELEDEMAEKADSWEERSTNLNEQLASAEAEKGRCQEALNSAISAKNILVEESNKKGEQHKDVQKMYKDKMAECKARIEEILYTDVCAVTKVRNTVMKSSKTSPPEDIDDCAVSDWTAGPCTVACDDSCPHMVGNAIDPTKCGGVKTLTRSVVTNNNSFGIACPALQRPMRCGQYKCAVDCVMSSWSAWSACTKDFETGRTARTRNILTKPKHGGKACETTMETEPCNTGSCDRNCKLDAWTGWSPCSMACTPQQGFAEPGKQERVRNVLVPIRGQGMCPLPTDVGKRFETQACNTHPCAGDEICIAKQDLIIMLDASGSLKEDGFEVLRDLAMNLTGKYKSLYYGANASRIGVVLFGNGARKDDGTIANAINVVGLTDDLALVKEKIAATEWQKGFTNLAQAFKQAGKMLQQGGREDAQSAVIVLYDGKESFAYETEKAAKELKAQNAMLYMATTASNIGDFWAKEVKNYEILPMLQVESNLDTFSSMLITKFCSDSLSPSSQLQEADQVMYMLVKEMGEPDHKCGPKVAPSMFQVENLE